MKSRASLRDVAAKAGIGIATASAVLNGSKTNTRVSEATRERVIAVASELNYHPNALARALTGQPTRTLGLLFGLERATVAVANPFAFAVIQGIVAGAAVERYNVTLFTDPWHDAQRSGGPWRDGRTDGVILLAVANDSDVIQTLTEIGVPVIAVSSACTDPNIMSVDVDNAFGARLATQTLIDYGHLRIAHLPGDDNLTNAIERQIAFLETCKDAGIDVPVDYMPAGSFEGPSGYERTLALLKLEDRPTAIFAANDTLAVAALQAAAELGLSVPRDLSVIGFDDIPVAEFTTPPLTTIQQPLAEIGATAARLLIDFLEGRPVDPNTVVFAPRLILRGSAGPVGG